MLDSIPGWLNRAAQACLVGSREAGNVRKLLRLFQRCMTSSHGSRSDGLGYFASNFMVAAMAMANPALGQLAMDAIKHDGDREK
jgi:hypothetical protein